MDTDEIDIPQSCLIKNCYSHLTRRHKGALEIFVSMREIERTMIMYRCNAINLNSRKLL